jgi:hypothetical protein
MNTKEFGSTEREVADTRLAKSREEFELSIVWLMRSTRGQL